MAKPKKIIRPVMKNVSLPEDLVAEVDLLLYSELEGRVPFGAWSRLVEGLLRGELRLLREELHLLEVVATSRKEQQ